MNDSDLEQMLFWLGVYKEEVARVVNVLNNWKGFKRICRD